MITSNDREKPDCIYFNWSFTEHENWDAFRELLKSNEVDILPQTQHTTTTDCGSTVHHVYLYAFRKR